MTIKLPRPQTINANRKDKGQVLVYKSKSMNGIAILSFDYATIAKNSHSIS
jgi:hypothetical protein